MRSLGYSPNMVEVSEYFSKYSKSKYIVITCELLWLLDELEIQVKECKFEAVYHNQRATNVHVDV